MKYQAMIVTAMIAFPALLTGCALPANVQIASWAVDGISFLTTRKSLTDHGLSLVARKDCAMWRGFTGQDICLEYDTGDVMVAAAGGRGGAPRIWNRGDTPKVPAGEPAAEGVALAPPAAAGDGGGSDLAAFETASSSPPAEETPAAAAAPMTAPMTAPATATFGGAPGGYLPGDPPKREIAAAAPPPRAAPVAPVVAVAMAAPPARRSEPSPPAKSAAGGRKDYLYVIGSFSLRGNAKRQAGRYAALGPAVVAAVSGGAKVYRVVVGPFARGQGKGLRRRIFAAGIGEVWTVRANPADRFLARYAGLAGRPAVAGPSRPSSVRVVMAIPKSIHRVTITIGPAHAAALNTGIAGTPGA